MNNKIGEGHPYLYARIVNEDGKYSPPLEIELNVLQIASFLVKTKNAHFVYLTNINDEVELETLPGSEGYLDFCRDEDFLSYDLLDTLILMQEGEINAEKVYITNWGVDKETLEKHGGPLGMRKWINEEFEVNL